MRFNKNVIPALMVAGLGVFAIATATVADIAHSESVARAHALEVQNDNHRAYMALVDATAADSARDMRASATIDEDSAGWDCATMGNRVCGPGNLAHVAGCYSDNGTMVAPWPCYVVVNSDGSSDVYTP